FRASWLPSSSFIPPTFIIPQIGTFCQDIDLTSSSPSRGSESSIVPYAVRELAFKNVTPRYLHDMVKDQLCDPVTYLEIDRLLLEVPDSDEEFAPIARIDHSLIDQQTPLAEGAGPAGDSAPQDFWHGDIDVGVYVDEGPGWDHRWSA